MPREGKGSNKDGRHYWLTPPELLDSFNKNLDSTMMHALIHGQATMKVSYQNGEIQLTLIHPFQDRPRGFARLWLNLKKARKWFSSFRSTSGS
jgi:hypothetical protein